MPEITQDAERITTQAVRIVRVLAATFFATASSGCATLMQPFSAVQPAAALVAPDRGSDSSIPDSESERFTSASIDAPWRTRVYSYRRER
jgi:hypothetical protein